MKAYVAWKASLASQQNAAIAANDVGHLRRQQLAVDLCDAQLRDWVLANAGDVVSRNVGEGIFELPMEKLALLPKRMDEYGQALQATPRVGIGTKLVECLRALKLATDKSRLFVLYSPEVEEELAQDQTLEKALAQNHGAGGGFGGFATGGGVASPAAPTAEASEHSEAEGARGAIADAAEGAPPAPEQTHAAADLEDQFHELATGQEQKDGSDQQAAAVTKQAAEARKKIASVLQTIRTQAPKIAELKARSPEAYQAIMGLVQGVIVMARALPMAKSEILAKADYPAGYRTDTPEFRQWFGQSKVTHPERLGEPLRVYHGTTHDFNEFSTKRGNPESWYGRAHYFTDNPGDAGANYATDSGPDIRNRIENELDRIERTKGDDANWDKEVERVRKKFVGPAARTIPTFLSMQNPVVVQPKGGTMFDYNEEMDENGDPTGKVTGNGEGLLNSIVRTCGAYQKHMPKLNHQNLIGHVMIHAPLYDGASAYQIEHAVRSYPPFQNMELQHSKSGADLTSEFVKDMWKNAGHDGIVMDAGHQFPNMVGPGTKHYIVFDPKKIKSAIGNTGAFDHKSKDFGKDELSPTLAKMALGDIPVGKPVPASRADKKSFDYNHILTPEQRTAGYGMTVTSYGNKIGAWARHGNRAIGFVEGDIDPRDKTLCIEHSKLMPDSRGHGIGKAAYEALMAHAKNMHGAVAVTGTDHSTSASRVHESLSAKHGMDYQPESTARRGEELPEADYDKAFSEYSYDLKSEISFNKTARPFLAAFQNADSGEVVVVGANHDTGLLPPEWDGNHIVDGFVSKDGEFLTRDEAAKTLKKGDDDELSRPAADIWHHGSKSFEGQSRPMYLTQSRALASLHGNVHSFKLAPDAVWHDIKDEPHSMDSVGYQPEVVARHQALGRDVLWSSHRHAGDQVYVTNPAKLIPHTESDLEKAQLPMPHAPTHKDLELPVGTMIEGGPGASTKRVGKIKVRHGNQKTTWIAARSGLVTAVADRHADPVLGTASHPLSSRNPSGT